MEQTTTLEDCKAQLGKHHSLGKMFAPRQTE